nr:MAG TPA: hypothetical protein [Caudoviricetes sp.]
MSLSTYHLVLDHLIPVQSEGYRFLKSEAS